MQSGSILQHGDSSISDFSCLVLLYYICVIFFLWHTVEQNLNVAIFSLPNQPSSARTPAEVISGKYM